MYFRLFSNITQSTGIDALQNIRITKNKSIVSFFVFAGFTTCKKCHYKVSTVQPSINLLGRLDRKAFNFVANLCKRLKSIDHWNTIYGNWFCLHFLKNYIMKISMLMLETAQKYCQFKLKYYFYFIIVSIFLVNIL